MTHLDMIRELQAVRREIATLEEVLALRVIQKRDLYAELFLEHRAQLSSDTKADAVVKQDARYADFERETAGIAHNRDDLLAKAESLELTIRYAYSSLQATGVAA